MKKTSRNGDGQKIAATYDVGSNGVSWYNMAGLFLVIKK